MTIATLPAMLGTEFLRLVEARDEVGVVSPTRLIWHRVDHAWKLALMSSIPTDCA